MDGALDSTKICPVADPEPGDVFTRDYEVRLDALVILRLTLDDDHSSAGAGAGGPKCVSSCGWPQERAAAMMTGTEAGRSRGDTDRSRAIVGLVGPVPLRVPMLRNVEVPATCRTTRLTPLGVASVT